MWHVGRSNFWSLSPYILFYNNNNNYYYVLTYFYYYIFVVIFILYLFIFRYIFVIIFNVFIYSVFCTVLFIYLYQKLTVLNHKPYFFLILSSLINSSNKILCVVQFLRNQITRYWWESCLNQSHNYKPSSFFTHLCTVDDSRF